MAKYTTPKAKELLEAGVHFGHQTRRWHPSMEKYIFGVKKNIHIIDLEDTEKLLKEACDFLYEVAKEGGQIIFVGTKRQAREMIAIEAKRCGALYVNERWLGGTITNFSEIRKNTKKYVDLVAKKEAGELSHYTKKEQLLIDRDIEKLQRSVGGIVGLKNIPAALFIIDPKREKTSVNESEVAGVKTVALIDTNTDPAGIDYVIPGNDDAIKSIALILQAVADAVEIGYKEFAKKSDKAEGAEKEANDDTPESNKSAVKVTADESRVSTEQAGKKAIKNASELESSEESDAEDLNEKEEEDKNA